MLRFIWPAQGSLLGMSPNIWNQSTQLVRTCVRPRKLPQDGTKRPMCAFTPPDWTSVRMRIHEARADNDVSACWSRWLALAEGEALDLCDVHGQQRAASVGRGQELLFF